MTDLALKVVLGPTYMRGRRVASIELGGVSIFSEIVNDTEATPAEVNIVLLFGERLQRLLRDED